MSYLHLFHRSSLLWPLLISLPAFWPVWQWYGARIFSTDGEYGALLALLTALGLMYKFSRNTGKNRANLQLAALLLLVYCTSYFFVPALVRALLAMLTISAVLLCHNKIKKIPIAIWGLVFLSLPVVASLQFYLGYPLRVIAGEISIFMLQLNGLSVVREGVILNWSGTLVSIDAPCSGVKMLWTGMFISLTLASLYRLRIFSVTLLLVMTLVIVTLVNAFRVTSLFYVETGIITDMHWAHDGIGILSFILIAFLLVYFTDYLSKRNATCTSGASL